MDPRPLIHGLAMGQRCTEQHLKKRGGSEMEVTAIGIDLAKSVFAVSGADSSGRVVVRRQLRRAQVLNFMGGLARCVVGMEACSGAHHWAREIKALGHDVRLMPASFVKGDHGVDPRCSAAGLAASYCAGT